MSSATSTESEPHLQGGSSEHAGDSGLEPWQFFTLAGLIGATIVVFLSEGQGPAAIILLSFVIFGAAAVGAAAWRTFAPLAGAERPFATQLLGGRTRAAIEREKTLVLRSIKDLEFDHAMGKVSDKDFADMDARLRSRAAGLTRQLDAGLGYRADIQREIDRRIGARLGARSSAVSSTAGSAESSRASSGASSAAASPVPSPAESQPAPAASRLCLACSTPNDADARFCKGCGSRLRNG